MKDLNQPNQTNNNNKISESISGNNESNEGNEDNENIPPLKDSEEFNSFLTDSPVSKNPFDLLVSSLFQDFQNTPFPTGLEKKIMGKISQLPIPKNGDLNKTPHSPKSPNVPIVPISKQSNPLPVPWAIGGAILIGLTGIIFLGQSVLNNHLQKTKQIILPTIQNGNPVIVKGFHFPHSNPFQLIQTMNPFIDPFASTVLYENQIYTLKGDQVAFASDSGDSYLINGQGSQVKFNHGSLILLKGKVWVKARKRGENDSPLSLQFKGGQVEVLGTVFMVQSSDQGTTIGVNRGLVSVSVSTSKKVPINSGLVRGGKKDLSVREKSARRSPLLSPHPFHPMEKPL